MNSATHINIQTDLSPTLGIVVPCYNEQDVLPVLFDALLNLKVRYPKLEHILFVDDGSSDRTPLLIDDFLKNQAICGYIRFSRNFGHQTAVSAGLKYVQGDLVAVLDADLQDPPALLPEMIQKLLEGFEVVYGIRSERKENFFLRCAYTAFYRVMKWLSQISVPLDAGDFAVMQRVVVNQINAMPERNRFIRGLRAWVGYNQVGFVYDRQCRQGGSTKYTFRKLMRLALDGIFNFSIVPLRAAVLLGMTVAVCGAFYLIYALSAKFFFDATPDGWASLASLILFIGGVQIFIIGIAGEYIGRIFEEVKNRPEFIVSETRGLVSTSVEE